MQRNVIARLDPTIAMGFGCVRLNVTANAWGLTNAISINHLEQQALDFDHCAFAMPVFSNMAGQ